MKTEMAMIRINSIELEIQKPSDKSDELRRGGVGKSRRGGWRSNGGQFHRVR